MRSIPILVVVLILLPVVALATPQTITIVPTDNVTFTFSATGNNPLTVTSVAAATCGTKLTLEDSTTCDTAGVALRNVGFIVNFTMPANAVTIYSITANSTFSTSGGNNCQMALLNTSTATYKQVASSACGASLTEHVFNFTMLSGTDFFSNANSTVSMMVSTTDDTGLIPLQADYMALQITYEPIPLPPISCANGNSSACTPLQTTVSPFPDMTFNIQLLLFLLLLFVAGGFYYYASER